MNYLFEAINENIYVLAVWDTSWNSYNNCYVVVQDEGVTLIDSGKKKHSAYLVHALNSIGKSTEDVTLLLATHGHGDHIEGAAVFKHAKKLIHPIDRSMVDPADSDQFHDLLSDRGSLQDYDYILVGCHTPGSIAIYHRPSKVLFTGDFLCFFGDPLSKDGLVSAGNDLRDEWLTFLKNGGVGKDGIKPFLEGLDALNSFDAEAMCTGHGQVLVGDIGQFISELVEAGEILQK